ncbi:MAG: site-specific integrase [Pseudomonadota bacterium]|nr:site-specific integrase [Pseudomonadota bacterium]
MNRRANQGSGVERLDSKDAAAYMPLFASSLARRGKSPATVSDYSRDARKFMQYLQQHRLELAYLDRSALERYCQHLYDEHNNSSNSVRRKVFGIRQFFDFLCAKRVIAANPFQAFALPRYIDKPNNAYRQIDFENIIAFLHANKRRRQLAMLYLLAYEGIKASELTALRWQDFLPTKQGAVLRIGGPRARVIELQQETTKALFAYRGKFSSRGATTNKTGMIFSGVRGPQRQELTRHGLKFLLTNLAQQTGSAPISCEKLRNHAIAFQFAQKQSAAAVMAHLGLRRVGRIIANQQVPKGTC